MSELRNHLLSAHHWSDGELFETLEGRSLERIHRAEHRQADYWASDHSVDNLRVQVVVVDGGIR